MRIAITGGIGEGKSSVVADLAAMGYRTASADAMARDVFGQEDIQASLAEAVSLPLPIDREALRATISREPAHRRMVNEITHPRILAMLLSSDATFVEVPLLLETCIQGHFHQVWVVTCGPEEQRKRLVERYGEGAQVDAIISSQLRTPAKTIFSDRIVRTNQPREHVRRLLSEAVKTL
jgi:dephospho-CoA kinase